MSTKHIVGNVTIGGVAKTLSDGYVNVNGVWKQLYKTYTNVDGVWKDAWESLFVWKKYNAVGTSVWEEKTEETTVRMFYSSGTFILYKVKTFDASTGKIGVDKSGGAKSVNYTAGYNTSYPYYSTDDVYKITGEGTYNQTSTGTRYYEYPALMYYSERVTTYTQGTYIEDVTSDNETAYPENGIHTDGYWYVKQ